MRTYLADFHIHSLLSPCAEIEMTPHHILMRARMAGVDMLALTDHNATGNLPAMMRLAPSYGIAVFPGMEAECLEGGHIVVLFDKMRQLAAWQRYVDDHMSGRDNDPDHFGNQFVVDEDDNFVREEKRLLAMSLELSAEKIVAKVNELGGLCIAAHIDRPYCSLLRALGFLPADMGLAAAEISWPGIKELKEQKLKKLAANLPYVSDSDAHRISDFLKGPKNRVTVEAPTIAELRLALKGEGGRSVEPGIFLENG